MKITDIEAIHLRVEDPNIGLFDGSYDDCVVRVRTDEGLTGIGEVESLAPAIQAIISAAPAHNHARGLRELLVGRDPSSPEELWDLMYDATDYVGRRGLVMRSEEHTSELQSRFDLVCRLLLEKKKSWQQSRMHSWQ